MSNAAFNTETARMLEAANHVRDVNLEIQSSLALLLSNLEHLFGAWEGSAAVSFHNLKQRWLDHANQLNDTLMRISEAIDKSRENYAQAEEVNTTGFSGIAGKL